MPTKRVLFPEQLAAIAEMYADPAVPKKDILSKFNISESWLHVHVTRPLKLTRRRVFNRTMWKEEHVKDLQQWSIEAGHRKYGLTSVTYGSLLLAQGGVCALCGGKGDWYTRKGVKKRKALAVDHDHQTGKVRGLLCTPCNAAVEHVVADPSRLPKAVRYALGSK